MLLVVNQCFREGYTAISSFRTHYVDTNGGGNVNTEGFPARDEGSVGNAVAIASAVGQEVIIDPQLFVYRTVWKATCRGSLIATRMVTIGDMAGWIGISRPESTHLSGQAQTPACAGNGQPSHSVPRPGT